MEQITTHQNGRIWSTFEDLGREATLGENGGQHTRWNRLTGMLLGEADCFLVSVEESKGEESGQINIISEKYQKKRLLAQCSLGFQNKA